MCASMHACVMDGWMDGGREGGREGGMDGAEELLNLQP